MNRRIFLFLIALMSIAVDAQTLQGDFVRDVQKDVAGWGKLVINQDSRLTRLVNRDSTVVPVPQSKEEKEKPADSTKQKVPAKTPIVTDENTEPVSRPAKLKRYKISGYRVLRPNVRRNVSRDISPKCRRIRISTLQDGYAG